MKKKQKKKEKEKEQENKREEDVEGYMELRTQNKREEKE